MQLKKLLEKRDLTSLRITTPFLELQWEPKDEDKSAAWGLYAKKKGRPLAEQGTAPMGGALRGVRP